MEMFSLLTDQTRGKEGWSCALEKSGGTVCNPYFWSSGSACVVCRQLGFEVDQGAGAFSDSKPTQMLMLSLPLTI